MTTSWKCPHCGLVNFAIDSSCKRCHAAVEAPASPATPRPAGIVLEDGYVLPPPPSVLPSPLPYGGIWRDQKILVMAKDAPLPDYCVKCNSPAHGFRLKRNLSWHPPALYVIILFAWLAYLIAALVIRKQATVYIGLCQEHVQKRKQLLAAGWISFGIGILGAGVAFESSYLGVGLLGILWTIIAIGWLAVVGKMVNVKKIDDRFVWLGGIDANYLARFPPLP